MTVAPPAGWAAEGISHPSGLNSAVFVFYHVIGAAREPSSYTFTSSSNTIGNLNIADVAGIDSSNPIAGMATDSAGWQQSVTFPGGSSRSPSRVFNQRRPMFPFWVLASDYISHGTTMAPPPGFAVMWNTNCFEGALGVGQVVATGTIQPSATSLSQPQDWATETLVLRGAGP